MADEAGRLIGSFLTGAVAGLVVVIVLAVLASRPDHPPRKGGAFLAVAAIIAIAVVMPVPLLVVAGVTVLALGGTTIFGSFTSKVFALPGAIMVVIGADTELAVPWLLLVVCLIVAATVLVADFDDRYGVRGHPFPLFAVSSLGLFLVVPETKAAAVFVAASFPAAFLGWPRPIARMGRTGALSIVGVFMWVALEGGQTRPETVVVATACLVFLLTEPVTRTILGGSPMVFTRRGSVLLVVGVQTATILVLAELPERFPPAWSIVVSFASLLAVTLAVCAFGVETAAAMTSTPDPVG